MTKKKQQSSSNRVLVRSDAHVWAHARSPKRLHETIDALAWTYEVAQSHGCGLVIDLGDLFHDRTKLDVSAFHAAFDLVRKYHAEGIDTLWLLGNHDQYYREDAAITSLVAMEPFGHVIKKPCTLMVNDIACDFLPWDQAGMRGGMKQLSGSNAEILFFHGSIEGALLNSRLKIRRPKSEEKMIELGIEEQIEDDTEDCASAEDFSGWKLALGGHYHAPQKIDSENGAHIEYVGSTIQHSYGEAGERKRVLLLDLKTQSFDCVFNDVSPSFAVLSYKDLPEDLGGYKNQRVRLEIEIDATTADIRETRERLAAVGALDCVVRKVGRERIDEKIGRARIHNAMEIVADGHKMVRTYARLQSPPDLNFDKLIAVGDRIVEAAEKS